MYEWIKALHVIAVIAWMAGMLYLPRLFVYHCIAEAGSKQSETFKVMERRLLKAIINPAMIVTWLAGLYLAWAGHLFATRNFVTKAADLCEKQNLVVVVGSGLLLEVPLKALAERFERVFLVGQLCHGDWRHRQR